jgi:hypothetical protein
MGNASGQEAASQIKEEKQRAEHPPAIACDQIMS